MFLAPTSRSAASAPESAVRASRQFGGQRSVAPRDGIERADLGVDSENASALRLYISLGYSPRRRAIAYVKDA